jgi:hypothetical protein
MKKYALAIALAVVLVATAPAAHGTTSMLGYVGCSNSTLSVQGFDALGGSGWWLAPNSNGAPAYDGGVIGRWAAVPTSTDWEEFHAAEADTPATAIWLQVCLLATQSASSGETSLPIVLDGLPAGVPVYLSAVNGYTDHVCAKVGHSGAARAQQVVDWGVSHGLARRGPLMPALSKAETTDGCHPNSTGQDKVGQALLAFFR